VVAESRGMNVVEGEWLVKSLKQSSRKGIRMCFCKTEVYWASILKFSNISSSLDIA